MPTRALITGGAGFIGSHLSERLIAAGQEVTIIDNLSTGQFENIAHLEGNPKFHYAIEDIRNATVMDRLVSECDVIYHLAAAVGVFSIVSTPIDTIEINVGGTEVVLRTARRYRTVQIKAGNQTLTAADPLPAELAEALAEINSHGVH